MRLSDGRIAAADQRQLLTRKDQLNGGPVLPGFSLGLDERLRRWKDRPPVSKVTNEPDTVANAIEAAMHSQAVRPSIASYRIEGRLDRPDEGAIEVVLELTDGRKRWCFFFTPERMSNVGDSLEGTRVRMHLGVNHMIVVSDLSHQIIEHVLRELEVKGLLLEHTRPLGEGAA
jgi:hypothetical protein